MIVRISRWFFSVDWIAQRVGRSSDLVDRDRVSGRDRALEAAEGLLRRLCALGAAGHDHDASAIMWCASHKR